MIKVIKITKLRSLWIFLHTKDTLALIFVRKTDCMKLLKRLAPELLDQLQNCINKNCVCSCIFNLNTCPYSWLIRSWVLFKNVGSTSENEKNFKNSLFQNASVKKLKFILIFSVPKLQWDMQIFFQIGVIYIRFGGLNVL